VSGTWCGDFFSGDRGGYVEKALEKGLTQHSGSAGEPGRGSYTGTLKDE